MAIVIPPPALAPPRNTELTPQAPAPAPRQPPEAQAEAAPRPQRAAKPTPAQAAEAARQMKALAKAKTESIANEVKSLHGFAEHVRENFKSPLTFEQDTAIRRRLSQFEGAMRGLGGSANVPEVHLLRSKLIPGNEPVATGDVTRAEAEAALVGTTIRQLAAAVPRAELTRSSRMMIGAELDKMDKIPALKSDKSVVKAAAQLEAHSPIRAAQAERELGDELKLRANAASTRRMSKSEIDDLDKFMAEVERYAPNLLETKPATDLLAHVS